MGRLIDADVLIKYLNVNHYASVLEACMKPIIEKQPTAYDVGKVVEELEKHKAQYGKLQLAHNNENMVYVYVGKEQAIDYAIEIVRKGGVG